MMMIRYRDSFSEIIETVNIVIFFHMNNQYYTPNLIALFFYI
jgi:hypothetical protein